MNKRNLKGFSKATSQKRHAQKRLRQRYGINIQNREYYSLCQQVLNRNAAFIKNQTNRTSLWWVTVRGISIRVVFDKYRKRIVTFF